MKKISVILACLLVTFLSSCRRSDALPIGQQVTVQFDPPADGAATSVRGKLLQANAEWIKIGQTELQQDAMLKHHIWVSRNKILLIQQTEQTENSAN